MPSDQNIESGCLKRAVGNSFQSLHFMMDWMHRIQCFILQDYNAIHTIMCMIFFSYLLILKTFGNAT